RAGVPQEHHRRGTGAPAFADIGTACFLANRVKIELAQRPLQVGVLLPARRTHLEPGRLPVLMDNVETAGSVGHGAASLPLSGEKATRRRASDRPSHPFPSSLDRRRTRLAASFRSEGPRLVAGSAR